MTLRLLSSIPTESRHLEAIHLDVKRPMRGCGPRLLVRKVRVSLAEIRHLGGAYCPKTHVYRQADSRSRHRAVSGSYIGRFLGRIGQIRTKPAFEQILEDSTELAEIVFASLQFVCRATVEFKIERHLASRHNEVRRFLQSRVSSRSLYRIPINDLFGVAPGLYERARHAGRLQRRLIHGLLGQ